jgi:hypothetical protein
MPAKTTPALSAYGSRPTPATPARPTPAKTHKSGPRRLTARRSARSGRPVGRAGGVTVDLVQLSLTVASGRRRQRYTTARTTQLPLTVVSSRRRQRYTTARTTQLPLTVVSSRRRQRYTTAGTTQLSPTVVSSRRRQRYTTAGSGWRTGRPLGAAEAAVPRSPEVRAHGTTPLKRTMSALIKQMRHAVLPGSAVGYLMGVVRGGTPLTSRHWLSQRRVTARA